MGRIYNCPISAVAVSAAQDLWEIKASATAVVRLRGVYIAQSSDTDSEQLRITIARVTGSPTSGSGGGTITPTPSLIGDPAFGGVVERNNTTQISGGTSVTVWDDSFNVLSGWAYCPPEPEMPTTGPGNYFVIALPAAPADSLTISGVAVIEEIG